MNQREFVQQYVMRAMTGRGVGYGHLPPFQEMVHEAIEVWAYIQKETVDDQQIKD